MNTPVSLEALATACDWVSGGEAAGLDCEAYVSRSTGAVHWSGEGFDEALPEGFDDETLFVCVPRKSEFDLGRSLALRFAEAHVPGELESVYDYFRSRGAYARFKSLLERLGQLDAWYTYEQAANDAALRERGSENGFMVVP